MDLPTRLGKAPLVDDLFEMRFKSRLPVASLLPGVLYSGLPGENSLEQLPASNFPEQLRKTESNLTYAPLVRLHWSDKYAISIGDRTLNVSCKIPYRGWGDFEPSIVKVVNLVQATKSVEIVERCSMKATNVVPKSIGGPKDVMVSKLTVGAYDVMDGGFHIRADIERDGLLHIVQLASEATSKLNDGTTRVGPLVDIDTILMKLDAPMDDFVVSLPGHLKRLHDSNKEMFFSVLKKTAVEQMDPEYD